jgi:hypothetical protein
VLRNVVVEAPRPRDGDYGQKWRCSFCGKHARDVEGLTSSPDEGAAICTECVDTLHELDERGRSQPHYRPGWVSVMEVLQHDD